MIKIKNYKESYILEYGKNNNISNYNNSYKNYKEVINDLISIIGDDECKNDIYNINYWYNYIKSIKNKKERS